MSTESEAGERTHVVTITAHDSSSKYGNRKRTYAATCSCSWASTRRPVQRGAAELEGERHVTDSDPGQTP